MGDIDDKTTYKKIYKRPVSYTHLDVYKRQATVNTDKRKKDVIIAINDKANDGRDVSWLWDVDFDKIADENLNTLTTTGIRVYDISLRFKYSDIKVDRMTQDMADAITKCLETDSEVVYVLVNYTALYSTEAVLKTIGGEA